MALRVKYVKEDKIYTKTEAAAAVGVSFRAFVKWFGNGDLIPVLDQGKTTYYSGSAINRKIDNLLETSAGRVKLKKD